jgi:sec-independent protein translocase protein TatA
MFEGIGPWHVAIVLIVVLLVFGPKRLPELSRSIGQAVTGFRQGLQETHDTIQNGPAAAETHAFEEGAPAPVTAAASASPSAAPAAAGTTPEAESRTDG